MEYDFKEIFDVVTKSWGGYLSSTDTLVILYLLNKILDNKELKVEEKLKPLADTCGVSLPSISRAMDAAASFGIFHISKGEKNINKIYLGEKLKSKIKK